MQSQCGILPFWFCSILHPLWSGVNDYTGCKVMENWGHHFFVNTHVPSHTSPADTAEMILHALYLVQSFTPGFISLPNWNGSILDPHTKHVNHKVPGNGESGPQGLKRKLWRIRLIVVSFNPGIRCCICIDFG